MKPKPFNFLNVKTDFLTLKTNKKPIKPIHNFSNINFFPGMPKTKIKTNVNFGLGKPVKRSKIKTINFFPAAERKNVKKNNMSWVQAKKKNPRLNPFGDADRDGVQNVFDCYPYNKKKDGIASTIKSAVSSVATKVAKAIEPTVTKVSSAYTAVDKSVFGGSLPGGAPKVTATTTPKSTPVMIMMTSSSVTTPNKSTSTPQKSSGGSSSSTLLKDAGIKTPTNTLLTDIATKSVSTSSGTKYTPTSTPVTTITGKTTGGGTITQTTIPAVKQETPRDVLVVTKPTAPITPKPTPGPSPSYYLRDIPVGPAPVTAQDVKGFFQETAGKYYRADRFKPSNITATADITPDQLQDIGIQTALKGRYPMILNINPNERTKIPDYILALKPTIIYTSTMPTRLAIMAPSTTSSGTTEYTEYKLKIADIPQ